MLGCFLHALTSVVVGRDLDGKAERDYVPDICEIVHQVRDGVIRGTNQIATDIADCKDGLANCDDESHDAARGLAILVHVATTDSESFGDTEGPPPSGMQGGCVNPVTG